MCSLYTITDYFISVYSGYILWNSILGNSVLFNSGLNGIPFDIMYDEADYFPISRNPVIITVTNND